MLSFEHPSRCLDIICQIEEGELFIIDEVAHPLDFDQSSATRVKISEAIARIPERINMSVIIRTYRGEMAEEVSDLGGYYVESLTSFRPGNGNLRCTPS